MSVSLCNVPEHQQPALDQAPRMPRTAANVRRCSSTVQAHSAVSLCRTPKRSVEPRLPDTLWQLGHGSESLSMRLEGVSGPRASHPNNKSCKSRTVATLRTIGSGPDRSRTALGATPAVSIAQHSLSSRLLPTPGSPDTSTTEPRHCADRSPPADHGEPSSRPIRRRHLSAIPTPPGCR
jgi:hypothetical protein